ncbi:MAG: hypothetical protein U1F10_03325 [Burkholderiales bacterium]
MRVAAHLAQAGVAFAVAACAATGPADSPPPYATRTLTDVPNAAAIVASQWAPGLADGYVPQGVAVGAGHRWVAAYRSTDPKQNRGPCRLFALDTDGAPAGTVDLPATCGHAGGTTFGRDGVLYVADAGHLYRIDARAALAAGRCAAEACRTLRVGGALRGSALAWRDGVLWFAPYRRSSEGTPHAWRVSEEAMADLLAVPDAVVDERVAQRAMPIAFETQGAAFAADGTLWLTQSGSRFGRLQRLDPLTGEVTAAFAMPAGIEDIEFDPQGRLWLVSEAGSQRWNAWAAFYPRVFAVDVARLR